MITRYDSLNISPENGKFFLSHQFYLSLTMKLKVLGDLNKIYNFQDTIILCEIFEHCSMHLQKLFECNP